MTTRTIEALVVSGRGKASQDRSAELEEMSQMLGMSLSPGSLNLVGKSPVWLDTKKAAYSKGSSHFYWNARLNKLPVIVNRWTESCPVHVYEVFSSEHLRARFQLADGDPVVLEIDEDIIDRKKDSSILSRIVWYLAWWKRERLAYQDGRYRTFLFDWRVHKLTKRAYQY